MLRLIVRYLKFSGTSAIGTVVDILVLWLLSDVVFDGRDWGEYVISPAISFQCAVAVNFLMSYFYVWLFKKINCSSNKHSNLCKGKNTAC